jgi:hypothetical protein
MYNNPSNRIVFKENIKQSNKEGLILDNIRISRYNI